MRRTNDRVVTHTPTRREAKMAKMAAATTTPSDPAGDAGAAGDEEDGPGSSARGMMMGRKRRGYAARGTPESVVRAPTMVMAEALNLHVATRTGRRGRRAGSRVRGERARRRGERGRCERRDGRWDGRARGRRGIRVRNAASVAEGANEPLACPATLQGAEDAACVPPGGESAGQSAPRPRGRVVRSLLEEFNAAERGLEEMLEARSDNTTLKNVNLDDFIPSHEPDSAGDAEGKRTVISCNNTRIYVACNYFVSSVPSSSPRSSSTATISLPRAHLALEVVERSDVKIQESPRDSL